MARKTIYTIIFLIPSLFLTSCKEKGLFDAGDVIKEKRELDSYKQIMIEGVFDFYLKNSPDGKSRITMTGREAVVNNIKNTITNDTLYVTDLSKYKWSRKYERCEIILEIPKELKKIDVQEMSYLSTIDTLKTDHLVIWYMDLLGEADLTIDAGYFHFANAFTNTGVYHIKGKANEARISMHAAGTAYAETLQAEKLVARSNSIGDIHCRANKICHYTLMNKGNIYLYNTPPQLVKKESYGSGNLFIK